ncbi:FKBP-type peptidyl-prolyl cis-trans isomerase [Jejudonia soesokkakensis]|uniref:FKBP-type peptidyl-prolyl cis-trans isomerase n=1 Tax=Jejudonia soesokkakensis TaxID=1323432 RepID=A0ABW2MWG3_9FLAO
MNKKFFLYPFLALTILLLSACGDDDDGDDSTPARDRGEEAIAAQLEIETYLGSHFYNYEEFANPPADFDNKVRIDTIAGENADKIPLLEQVEFKIVQDRFEEDVEYKLYFLKVTQGGGDSPNFPDIVNVTYDGFNLEGEVFDSSLIPAQFDLTLTIDGFQDVLVEFNGASVIIDNPDGSISYENFGIGAMFVPSGLGYFDNAAISSSLEAYSQLVFTFQLIDARVGDQDNDGIPSIMEDLNLNNRVDDDDTDEDLRPNYFDSDDDNDGRPTRDEIEIDSQGNITFPDVDGDGIPDYLDADS